MDLTDKRVNPIMIVFNHGVPLHVTTDDGRGYDVEYCKRDECLYWECTSAGMDKDKMWVPCGGDVWVADGYTIDPESTNDIILERPDPYKLHPSLWENFDMSDTVYCSICEDWLPGEDCYPTENGCAVCDHVWWSKEDGWWAGHGLQG